jgi:nicotinamide-nucleotide amidase
MTRVIPEIKKRYQTPVIQHKMVMTAGIGESWLSEKIAGWEKICPVIYHWPTCRAMVR